MNREIVIRTRKEAEASVEELYKLRKAAFQQWTDAGLYTSVAHGSLEGFRQYLTDKAVFVAQDAETGELLAMHSLRLNQKKGRAYGANLAVSPSAKNEGIASLMLQEEVKRLRKAGYRYIIENTAIPATWSVRWHQKNGYHIVGYSRSEPNNYASYIFRMQFAYDIKHHPSDILWTRPVAPLTARIQFAAYYIATCICKTREGRLNALGRWIKRLLRK